MLTLFFRGEKFPLITFTTHNSAVGSTALSTTAELCTPGLAAFLISTGIAWSWAKSMNKWFEL
jgi:hypothetical protein